MKRVLIGMFLGLIVLILLGFIVFTLSYAFKEAYGIKGMIIFWVYLAGVCVSFIFFIHREFKTLEELDIDEERGITLFDLFFYMFISVLFSWIPIICDYLWEHNGPVVFSRKDKDKLVKLIKKLIKIGR